MSQFSNDFIRRIKIPAYLLIAFMSVGSVVELLVAASPIRLHDLNWRLGVVNTAAAATGTELLALLLLVVVAQLALSSAALWTAFWYAVLAALGYLVMAGTFALDSLQMRGRVPADQVGRFDLTVGWALARFALAELVCLWLAACALAAARNLGRESARASADPRAGLVVGTGAQPAPFTSAARSDA